jgi:murein DD-endopeptidase MepM/ murein hydrolase activator NlpD
MFRHDERRTGYHGPPFGKPLAVYIGSDDHYLYVLDGRNGSLIDRFLTYGPIHTSPSVADVDGDKKLEIFFYDWGTGSSYGGHTFWAVKDRGSMPTPKFMTLPFNDPTINIVQGWIYTWGTPHRGIDYIKGQVTEEPKNWQEFKVLAVADGEAKYVPMDEPGGNQTWGNYVVTKHVIQGKTYYTVNAHLSKSPLPKNEWVSIKRGVEIGTAGDSGNMPRCKKPCIHLHFEVATDWPPMGAKIDPYDIYSTRDYYPGGSKFTECGSNYLWATCPPSSP